MSRHRSSYVVYESDESSDDYPPPIQVERPKGKVVRLGSEYGGSQRSHKSKKITIRDSSPAPVVVENFLSIPNQRPRASSTGAAPQPNYVPVYIQGSQSGSPNRHKHYHHHHHDSESDDSFYSGSRGRRRPSSHRGSIDWETQQQLAKLKLKEEQEARDAAEAAALAKYEDRQRRQSEQTKQALLEAEDKRKRDKDELEARIAAAEAKRKREEAEEKEHRIQIIREEREREEKKKKDDEEMRKRILREEDERVEKEKAKKKKEEDEFNQKVKERFMKAGRFDLEDKILHALINSFTGYDPEYIEAILAEKKKKNKDELAIDLSRPTYIRVQRKHLHPDTLDFYCLPWEYDSVSFAMQSRCMIQS